MKEWFKKWLQGFWDKHGERIFFASAASAFGIGFIITGVLTQSLKEFVGAGTTILIGVGMMFFNKMRSPENEVTNTEEVPNEEGK